MATYTLFGGSPGGSQVTDGGDYTMGVEFWITESDCTLTGLRFGWAGGTVATNHAARLYLVNSGGTTGSLVSGSTKALSQPLTDGWNTVTFDAPIPLTPNQRYRASVFFTTDNGYTATGGYWTTGPGASGITNGPLVAPSAAAAAGGLQGAFTTAPDDFPSLSFNGGNYWVDPIVEGPEPTPQVPVVNAGADITVPFGTQVTRTATGTHTPTSWAWTVTAGPITGSIGTTASLSWTPTSPGTYTISVVASNAAGDSAPDTITVTVEPPPGSGFRPHGFFAI